MQGLNIGHSTGIKKLDYYIDGIQRSTITTLAGGTGSGKSTLALYSYVYKPLMENLNNDNYKVVYYSLEMSATMLYTKLLSMYIYDTYGLQLTYKQILSRGRVLDPELYEVLVEAREWLEKIRKHLVIYDKGLTTSQLTKHLAEYAKQNGTFEEKDNTIVYTPKVQNQTVMVIIDHLLLLKTEGKQTKKLAMDECSKVLIEFRNTCSYSALMLMQLNRASSSMDRRKGNYQEPELSDLKESGDPGEASDIVMAIFSPFKEKVPNYRGFNMEIVRDFYRSIIILKSRFGEANHGVHVNFHGNVGIFLDMPNADEINDYTPYLILGAEPKIEDKKVKGQTHQFTL